MPIWAINDLNCFDSHTLNIYLHNSGQLVYGTAIAPDGSRCAHVWVERNGSLVDIFGWKEHIKQGCHFYPSPDEVIKMLIWLDDNMLSLSDYN